MAFTDDVKKYVDKGIAVSKDAFTKAGNAVSKFGDQSVKKVEKLQLESKLKQQFAQLGETVYEAFATNAAEQLEKASVQTFLDTIATIKADIAAREEALRNLKKESEKSN